MPHEKFYWCTDDAAVSHIEDFLDIEGLNILDPREDLRKKVYTVVTDPKNVGDLHI
jgi:hypothetical protein